LEVNNHSLRPIYIYIIKKKNFIILGEKIIGSRPPRAVDRTTMRLGGNERKQDGGKFFLLSL
jgi:hypothetical protein